MDKNFLMGNGDGLTRSRSNRDQTTLISSNLHTKLMTAAIDRAAKFYSDFFNLPTQDYDVNELATEYREHFSDAMSLGLFADGGIREKDHLNFWCLGHLLNPEVYVESGVFIGSSLHAYVGSPGLKRTIAIDPNLSKLKVPKSQIPGAKLIDEMDFSQVEFDIADKTAIVYFDDHINSADRVLQSHEKGFKYLLFDDSNGFEGICQRLYPATPTIPMIMNCDMLSPGDELSWSFQATPTANFSSMMKGVIRSVINPGGTRLTYSITKELIDYCFGVRKLIKKCEKLPDLGDYIPQSITGRTVETSKYLVELIQN